MATLTVAQPQSSDTRQRRLLHLDCSADLQSYSRNLGPGVQEKIFQRTSDALRAQLEEHRDFLLAQQQRGQAKLSPVPQLHCSVAPSPQAMHPTHQATPLFRQPQRHVQPPHPQHHAQPPQLQHHVQPPRPQPQPPQPFTAPWPPALRAPIPTPGDIETYPPALRDALKRCSPQPSATPDNTTLYHVTHELQSNYMSDEHEVVATYRNPQAANNKVAEYFVENFLTHDDGFDAQYEVSPSGTLRCEKETDGSLGGWVTVSVTQGRMND